MRKKSQILQTEVESPEETDSLQKVEQHVGSVSSRILNVRWLEFFPFEIAQDEVIRLVDFSEVTHFIQKNHLPIFDEGQWGNPFFKENSTLGKLRYLEDYADCFMYFKAEQAYAVTICTLSDWSSYYLRYGAFLKDYQNTGRAQLFLNHLIGVLKNTEVNRIETDISPANLSNLHIFNKLGFNITGINNTERWGSLIRMTKFLNTKAENVFLDQFCQGPRPQVNSTEAKDNVIALRSKPRRGNK